MGGCVRTLEGEHLKVNEARHQICFHRALRLILVESACQLSMKEIIGRNKVHQLHMSLIVPREKTGNLPKTKRKPPKIRAILGIDTPLIFL